MECNQTTWLSNKEYWQRFTRKVADLHIPFSGSLDLTHYCNLRCVHCYLGDKESINKNGGPELTTAQWMSIIDDITKAGCLFILFTGGEPLLRKDFSQIYRHAKTNGLFVTLFTNGTLITEGVLQLFDDLPPHSVEISLYGATADTFEAVTGIKGSYDKCLSGIERLLDQNINLRLKTILMTSNCHEFYVMEQMAEEYGVKFRFDAAIFPCLDGNKTPLDLRVPPEEAIEKEFSNNNRLHQWKDLNERFQGAPVTDDLFQCGAGRVTFHVDPHGSLRPCVMVKSLTYNLLSGNFSSGWYDVHNRIRKKKAGAGVCSQCEKKLLCGYCPGFFELENGDENAYSEYLCVMGQYRLEAIIDSYLKGNPNAVNAR